MGEYKYLIVGGGMTGAAAVGGIRSQDSDGSIGMISAEAHPPYNRPPLSKGLWKGKPEDDIWRGLNPDQVDLTLNRTVVSLDPAKHEVTDDKGDTYQYERLLLATGGTPRRLPFGGEQILYFRTLEDYRRLRQLSEQGASVAVIGGGFIGSELAAALAEAGNDVTMIFPETAIGAGRFPDGLGQYLNDDYRRRGVQLLAGHMVSDVAAAGEMVQVTTKQGEQVEAQAVVAGLGIVPNTAFAEAAGLQVEDGIVVNEQMQTTVADVYAAGDVAAFHNPILDMRMRVEHEDNANSMGELAGQAMAGADVRYHHLPYFYSDMFDNGYEALGVLDNRLQVVEDWQQPNEQGVLYYLRDERVVGVVLWNTWGKLDEARAVLELPAPVEASTLEGRIG